VAATSVVVRHTVLVAQATEQEQRSMKELGSSRRRSVKAARAGTGLPLAAPSAPDDAGRGSAVKVVCLGAHPDDPESGCAGTLARYVAAGHAVTIVYLTRGERGIEGVSDAEAATIRTAESEAACRVLGAKARFVGQINGETEATRAWAERLRVVLAAEKPDVLFTHWPIDSNFDHLVASMLTIAAWKALEPRPQLYFFEVNTGQQSQGFAPDTYVDISAVVETKRAALFAHESQDGEGIWRDHHEVIAAVRGREAGVDAAEAFVHLSRASNAAALPAG
jgi:LmbE family N-acetylglucosaminyl deacetylase